jgi:cytidylate kinase
MWKNKRAILAIILSNLTGAGGLPPKNTLVKDNTLATANNLPSVIAIDGPAASGKSTLGKNLADELRYLFFDTGVMYRAVTWAALQRGLNLKNEAQISDLAEQIEIDVRPPSEDDGRTCDILTDGEDVTWDVRRDEVDANVSIVSAYPRVRQALTLQQRRIGLRGKVVMVGRDIGTVVLPDAQLKLYLDASAEERARRRHEELYQRNEPAQYGHILSLMQRRDQIDSTRSIAPLRAADDAIRLDSNNLDADQVLDFVKALIIKGFVQNQNQP